MKLDTLPPGPNPFKAWIRGKWRIRVPETLSASDSQFSTLLQLESSASTLSSVRTSCLDQILFKIRPTQAKWALQSFLLISIYLSVCLMNFSSGLDQQSFFSPVYKAMILGLLSALTAHHFSCWPKWGMQVFGTSTLASFLKYVCGQWT